MDPYEIINRYYPDPSPLRDVLVIHSRQVTQLALTLARRLSEPVDMDFVAQAAMLHDIGIYLTDAPGIHCHGTEPYIRHGIIGSQLLTRLGYPRHALVCERHTGAGLSLDDIISQNLPLPHRPMLPVSLEEQLICYADKFFSKTHLGEPPRSLDRVRKSLSRFGPDTITRFQTLADRFGTPD